MPKNLVFSDKNFIFAPQKCHFCRLKLTKQFANNNYKLTIST